MRRRRRLRCKGVERERAMAEQLLQSKAQVAALLADIRIKDAALEAHADVHKAEVDLLETKLQSMEVALQASLHRKEAAIQSKDALVRRVQSGQGRGDGPVASGAAQQSSARAAGGSSAPAPAPAPAVAVGCVAPSGPGFLCIFGSEGSSKKKLKQPRFMEWDRQGNVVVADQGNHCLQVIRLSEGAHLRTIGSKQALVNSTNPTAWRLTVQATSSWLARVMIECRCCATATAATYEPSAAEAVKTGSFPFPAAFWSTAKGASSWATRSIIAYRCCSEQQQPFPARCAQ
jgi:hypothetical protein